MPSSTAKDTGNSVSVSYGSGSFSGEEYTDNISLGSGFTIKSQSVGDASSATGFSGVDGIIGRCSALNPSLYVADTNLCVKMIFQVLDLTTSRQEP